MRRLTGGGRANTQARLESGRGCGTRRAGLCGPLHISPMKGEQGALENGVGSVYETITSCSPRPLSPLTNVNVSNVLRAWRAWGLARCNSHTGASGPRKPRSWAEMR